MSASRPSVIRACFEWAQAVVLAANVAWTTACLGGFLARTMVVTTGLTIALALLHAVVTIVRPETERGAAAGLPFVPFLLFTAVSARWLTPVPWLGWIDSYGWLEAVLVFAVASTLRRSSVRWFLWGTLFAVALGGVAAAAWQRFVDPTWLMLGREQVDQYLARSSGFFGSPNSFAALLLLVLPTAGALAAGRRTHLLWRVFFAWLALVLGFGLVLTISRGAWLGLFVALASWPLWFGRRSWRVRLGFVAAILAGCVVLAAAGYLASPKIQDRLVHFVRDSGERSRPIMWRAGWREFLARPWTGSGAGSFDTVFEKHRPEGVVLRPVWAHNDYLNTLSDYGVIGVLLLAVGVGVQIWRARRAGVIPSPTDVGQGGTRELSSGRFRGSHRARDPFAQTIVRQAQAIGLFAFALQLFVDFHFKIPALAMAFAIVAAFTLRSGEAAPRTSTIIRPLWAAGCAGAAVFAFAWILPLYRAEALRENARRAIDRLAEVAIAPETPEYGRTVAQARQQLARAVELCPRDAAAWADLAYAEAQTTFTEHDAMAEWGRRAEAHADRALTLAPTIAEFWIRRGVGRDLQQRWFDAGADFTAALRLAPAAPAPWFYYAFHLSLRPTGRDMAEAAVSTCLRLDPKNREALRLRQQLAAGPAP
jgi:O-antigen ligase